MEGVAQMVYGQDFIFACVGVIFLIALVIALWIFGELMTER